MYEINDMKFTIFMFLFFFFRLIKPKFTFMLHSDHVERPHESIEKSIQFGET